MRITNSEPVRRPTSHRGRLAIGVIAALVLGLTAACGDDSDPTKSADQKDLAVAAQRLKAARSAEDLLNTTAVAGHRPPQDL